MDISQIVTLAVGNDTGLNARKLATDILQHNKKIYTELHDDFGNVWALMFDEYILDLRTCEVEMIH